MRLLSLFTMGVPSTESSLPMAHLLPLVLSTLLCLGGSLLYASDWFDNYPLNSVSFMALFVTQFCFLAQGCAPLYLSVPAQRLRPAPPRHARQWVRGIKIDRSLWLQLAVFSHAGDVQALPRARRAVLELDAPVA